MKLDALEWRATLQPLIYSIVSSQFAAELVQHWHSGKVQSIDRMVAENRMRYEHDG